MRLTFCIHTSPTHLAAVSFWAVHIGILLPVNIKVTNDWASHPCKCFSNFKIGVCDRLLGFALEYLDCVHVWLPGAFLIKLVHLLLLLSKETLLWRTIATLLLWLTRLWQLFLLCVLFLFGNSDFRLHRIYLVVIDQFPEIERWNWHLWLIWVRTCVQMVTFVCAAVILNSALIYLVDELLGDFDFSIIGTAVIQLGNLLISFLWEVCRAPLILFVILLNDKLRHSL